jgi:uncharacterized small protein (DUF1192 family)
LSLGTGFPPQAGQAAVYFRQLQRYPLIILWQMLDNFARRETLIGLSLKSFNPCPSVADMMAECSALLHEQREGKRQEEQPAPLAVSSTDFRHEIADGTRRLLLSAQTDRQKMATLGGEIARLIAELKAKYKVS